MLKFYYTLRNNFNGKSFKIGYDLADNETCDSGKGILLQEYPQFELEVRNEERVKAGQHGIWDFFSFYGKRVITFSGLILATDHKELVTYQRLMKEVLALPAQPIAGLNDGYIEVTWFDDDNIEWFINAKITQDLQFPRRLGLQRQSQFFIGLKASEGEILTKILNSQDQIHGWVGNQMALPAFLPNNFNVVYNNLIDVYSIGSADASGIYRIDGPLVNPVISKFTETYSNNLVVGDFSTPWTGGTEDTVHYQVSNVAQKITSSNGVQAVMSKLGSWDLNDPEYITFFFYVDNAENMAWGDYDYQEGEIYAKFIDNNGVDEFVAPLINGCPTIKNGWNYFRLLRDQFIIIGNPSWSTITEIEFSIKSKVGTDLTVTFDDLNCRDITDTEGRLELDLTLGYDDWVEFDVKAGTVLRENGNDVSGLVTLASEWLYVSPRQNLFLLQSGANPLLTNEFPYTFVNPMDEEGLIGDWHFDDKAPGIATDFVSGNNGIIDGAVQYVDSPIQESLWAVEFNGTSGDIVVPDEPTLHNIFDIGGAISFWINADDAGENGEGYIIAKDNGANGWGVRVVADSGGTLKLGFWSRFSAGLGQWDMTDFEINVDEDTHIIITYDSSSDSNQPVMYVNRVQVPLTETSSPAGTRKTDVSVDMYFGNSDAGDRTWNGYIDKIRLYNDSSVITETKINELFYHPSINEIKKQLTVSWRDTIL